MERGGVGGLSLEPNRTVYVCLEKGVGMPGRVSGLLYGWGDNQLQKRPLGLGDRFEFFGGGLGKELCIPRSLLSRWWSIERECIIGRRFFLPLERKIWRLRMHATQRKIAGLRRPTGPSNTKISGNDVDKSKRKDKPSPHSTTMWAWQSLLSSSPLGLVIGCVWYKSKWSFMRLDKIFAKGDYVGSKKVDLLRCALGFFLAVVWELYRS